MNLIPATVLSIQSLQSLTTVSFDFQSTVLHMISLQLPEGVVAGRQVTLGIKSSAVTLIKDIKVPTTDANALPAVVSSIGHGELLCTVQCEVNGLLIEVLMSRKAYEGLDLHLHESVILLIKESELFISGVDDV